MDQRGFEEAALVALGVAQHHPGDIKGLPDVGARGAPGEEVVHGRRLVLGVQVEVQAVGGLLRLVHANEEQRRRRPVRRPNFDTGRVRIHSRRLGVLRLGVAPPVR